MPDTSTDDAIVLSERIRATPDQVFDFLVDPERLLRWMGKEADIDPRPGGKFWLDITGSDIAVGEYVEVDRPTKLVFTWGWEGSTDVPPGSSVVTFNLSEEGDETVVELVHAGLPGGASDQHVEGWTRYLPLLVEAASTG